MNNKLKELDHKYKEQLRNNSDLQNKIDEITNVVNNQSKKLKARDASYYKLEEKLAAQRKQLASLQQEKMTLIES